MLPEINRKFSDSVPLSEKCYDKQFFMSQDNQDFGKNDEVFEIFLFSYKQCFFF